uniref:Uncharacterized protein n=1 Tax=Romanomermis culicivorax TaxID=13658 RepID=A0A915HWW9_ROMCU
MFVLRKSIKYKGALLRLKFRHRGRYFKTGAGLNLGPGPFVRALEYATDKEAVVIGKPEPSFFQSAMEKCDVSVDRGDEIFMIGDDVRDDIEGAQLLGIKGLLVKTGKYREGDETRIYPKPWRLVENFAHAVEILCEYQIFPLKDSLPTSVLPHQKRVLNGLGKFSAAISAPSRFGASHFGAS